MIQIPRRAPVLVGALSLLLVAACGSDQISPNVVPPTPDIEPSACSLLPADAIARALTPPGASPAPAPTGTYAVVTLSGHNAGQCTYVGVTGARLVVTVVPKASLADLGISGTSLGPATVVSSTTASLLALEQGPTVIELALDMGGVPASERDNRLAALAAILTRAPLPTETPGAVAQASPTATPTPAAPSGPGTVVTGQPAAVTVKETDQLRFVPESVTVKVGDVVEWVNSGSVPHNVTFDAYPSLTSPTMNGGDRHEVRFTRPGTYQYHCTFHPGMNGTVVVG